MIYQFIKEYEMIYPVDLMCLLLKVSRSGYYYWKLNPVGKLQTRKQALKEKIKEAYFDAKGLYGSPRITVELACNSHIVSRTTVARYMKDMNIQSKHRKKYKVTTDSNHKEPIFDNLLNRNFSPDKPSQALVSDITYIPVLEGFLYLTTVMDLFDRKIIGWSISDGMNTDETVMAAFKMAVKNRVPSSNMIFHSDRGVQYASHKFRNYVASYNIRQSMSRKGNCWDNAVAESFFKSLKTEMIYGFKKLSKDNMKAALFQYIEIWYNRKRRHSFLNNLNIEEFWRELYSKNEKFLNVA